MKKQSLLKGYFAIFYLLSFMIPAGQVFARPFTIPNLTINSKVLITGRAIASWPLGIPPGEKRPVVVFLPGWDGTGAVNAAVSAQNLNLSNEGYVTLAIGFDSSAEWISDIEVKTAQGLDALCADTSIPANCNAIVLDGESYGGAQNYWVTEYLRGMGYAGTKGRVLGFLSEDAGYGAPGTMTNSQTGAYTRTGLANTNAYSVAIIENLGDSTFPVDECTWGNCGARELGSAHLARGDNNVFSICPAGGEHGTRGFTNWDAWVISAIKTMIHITNGIPTFTGYNPPTLSVSNACTKTANLPGLSVSGINIVAGGQPVLLRGVNMGDPFGARNQDWYPMYSTADYANLARNWGANIVRISIFPTQWKNMDHPTLLAGLAREVNAALNNGMYVIISYHVIGWPDGWYQSAYPGNPPDTYDSSMSVASSFWTQMAQTFGSDQRIIFDLWNEPAHDSSDWVGVTPNPVWPELKLAYESLIHIVRYNGAQNIVLATGNRWASWLMGIKDNPLSDENVVYAYHKYSVNGSNSAAEWNQDTGGLLGVKPILVSEWGYEDSDVSNPTWSGSQASYGEPFTQWLDSHQLGSLVWMYHYDWTPALLKADGGLTLYGTFAKQYISDIKTTSMPGGFSKSSPGTGSPVGLPVTIAWGASTGASSYDYCVTNTSNFNTCTWETGITGASQLLSNLTAGTTYYWQVRAVNTVGKTYANGSATSFWTFKTIASSPPFFSAGAQDGWILESKETSSVGGTQNPTGTTLLVGDAVGDKQYRSILSFDTSALPDKAVVVSATLKLRKNSLVGTDPFKTPIGMVYDMRKPYFGTSSAMVATDFQASATLSNTGSFSSAAVSNWYSAILSITARNNINKTGLTQFRIRFAKDDNDDNGNDYFAFYSGNYGLATYRPTLVITYYLP